MKLLCRSSSLPFTACYEAAAADRVQSLCWCHWVALMHMELGLPLSTRERWSPPQGRSRPWTLVCSSSCASAPSSSKVSESPHLRSLTEVYQAPSYTRWPEARPSAPQARRLQPIETCAHRSSQSDETMRSASSPDLLSCAGSRQENSRTSPRSRHRHWRVLQVATAWLRRSQWPWPLCCCPDARPSRATRTSPLGARGSSARTVCRHEDKDLRGAGIKSSTENHNPTR